jgi:hypothetical protein
MTAQPRLPTGELQPLPILEGHWKTISVDFIIELPESGGYDTIMVVVDSAGKQSHFVETVTTITATGAANLYLRNVWKLHGLPQKVISDCGLQFVELFMKELCCLLEIEAALSTTYHPQTDSQTECINQELEQFLQIFIREQQNDWYSLLPLAEFSYNNYCKGNPHLPDPNRSKPLAGPDQTYPLVSLAARSAPDCSAHAITIPLPSASLYILPHRRTHRLLKVASVGTCKATVRQR